MRKMIEGDILMPKSERAGIWIKLTEIYGTMGVSEYRVERPPFWFVFPETK
jgi:hypothetical protein